MLLLLVEDERHIRIGIAEMLSDEGYQILQAETLQQALQMVDDESPDAVLSDINLPDGDGFTLLQYCHTQQREIPVIFMTAFGGRELALQAMGQGAYDYITKPIRFDELFARLHRLKEVRHLKKRVNRKSVESQLAILGESSAMMRVRKVAEKAALSNAPVFITGETGVGKGLLATLLHNSGGRREAPFISINCASIPENLLESEMFGYRKGAFTGANSNKKGVFDEVMEGTLLLDEIGEMPLSLQAKLLHVLDNGMFCPLGGGGRNHVFKGRIIAATNIPIDQLIDGGCLRRDLYYRLSVITIKIPSLNERPEDLLPLAAYIYHELACEMGHTQQRLPIKLANTLQQQSWPGNVRQLRNHIERFLIFNEDEDENGTDVIGDLPLATVMQKFEKDVIQLAIDGCDGDKSAAAKQLAIGLSTLYRKLEC